MYDVDNVYSISVCVPVVYLQVLYLPGTCWTRHQVSAEDIPGLSLGCSSPPEIIKHNS